MWLKCPKFYWQRCIFALNLLAMKILIRNRAYKVCITTDVLLVGGTPLATHFVIRKLLHSFVHPSTIFFLPFLLLPRWIENSGSQNTWYFSIFWHILTQSYWKFVFDLYSLGPFLFTYKQIQILKWKIGYTRKIICPKLENVSAALRYFFLTFFSFFLYFLATG